MSRRLAAKGKLMSEVFNLRQSSSKEAEAAKLARATIAKREEEMRRTLEAKGKQSSKLWHLQQAMSKMEDEHEDALYDERQKVASLTKQLEEGKTSHADQACTFENEVDELKRHLSEHKEKIKELEAEYKVIAKVHRERIHHLETEIVELREHHSGQLLRIERENELLKQELLDLDGEAGKDIIENARERVAELKSIEDAGYTDNLREKEEELSALLRQMDDLREAHKSENASLETLHKDSRETEVSFGGIQKSRRRTK